MSRDSNVPRFYASRFGRFYNSVAESVGVAQQSFWQLFYWGFPLACARHAVISSEIVQPKLLICRVIGNLNLHVRFRLRLSGTVAFTRDNA
jgi:hypothetical protein